MKHSNVDNSQRMQRHTRPERRLGFVCIALCLFGAVSSYAQTSPGAPSSEPLLNIYGFAMMDTGIQLRQSDPDWFDVLRPTKLPAFRDEFGKDGHWFAGVRQTRFGLKGNLPGGAEGIKTVFEFELLGTGADAGKTTFRLRHAWGEYHKIGAGQYWSTFMDPDIYPNEVEYWGPVGMVWYRNVQVRWAVWRSGDSNFMIAAERPGASADQGLYADRLEIQNIKARFSMPDISTHYRIAGDWGHFQAAAIYRKIKWDDTLDDQFDLSGNANGWGVNLSSNIKIRKDVIRLQAVYGHGIQNYMNDAPVDVGTVNDPSNATTPITGKALPIFAMTAFLDHTWSDKFTTTIGYSREDIDNSEGQPANAFKSGEYAVTNVLYAPAKGVLLGPEFQWGRRRNNSDGWLADDYRIQFSLKYNFSADIAK